jgi:hypothetical protein
MKMLAIAAGRRSLMAFAVLASALFWASGAEASNQLMLSCDGVSIVQDPYQSSEKKETVQGRSLVIDLDRHTMQWGGASRAIPLTEVTETRITSTLINTDNLYFAEYTTNIDRISGAVSTIDTFRNPKTHQWVYTESGNLICHVVRDRLF